MTPLAFHYRGESIPVKHQIHRRYTRIHLHVRPDHILIKSPAVARRHIQRMLTDNTAWIQEKWEHQKTLAAQLPETALYLGRARHLQYHLDPLPHFADGRIYLPACADREAVVRALKTFYAATARDYLPQRLDYWSERMGLYPQQLRLKYLKSRWGSCSSKKNINLNYRAMQLSKPAIDTILIHELAHLKHMNHGEAFWKLVYTFSPDYDYHHQHLKTLGEHLF